MVSTSNKNCLHYWDLCDYIPIDAAVALWCDVEPSQLRNLNFSTNCMDVKRELIEWSLYKGELDYVSSSDAWYSANLEELIRKDQVRLKKDSLRDWFLNLPTGDRPAFLFDDSRTNALIKTGLSETERQTMLKLIIGMAIDAYGYDPEATKNKATGENSGSIKAALDKNGISIDADTIRKYLTEAKELL